MWWLLIASCSLGLVFPDTITARKDATPTCMDPTSQPQFQFNTNCPSSLTSPTECMQTEFYRYKCAAYCEQYLWWFYGPEVPIQNSQCSVNDSCTFAGANSLAITNTYTFSAGFGASSDDLLKLAFDAGASYSYSETRTTTQTLTKTRPKNTTDYCGYWTFLPYYVQSCGFFLNRKVHSFAGGSPPTAWQECVGYPSITFQCNNSTFVDSNGNAEGITIFVATFCNSNKRLPREQQDARYYSSKDIEYFDYEQDRTDNDFNDEEQSPAAPNPSAWQIIKRYCLCNFYDRNPPPYHGYRDSYKGMVYYDLTSILTLVGAIDRSGNGSVCLEVYKSLFDRDTISGVNGEFINVTQFNLSLSYVVLGPDNYARFWNDMRINNTVVEVGEDASGLTQIPFECFGDLDDVPLRSWEDLGVHDHV